MATGDKECHRCSGLISKQDDKVVVTFKRHGKAYVHTYHPGCSPVGFIPSLMKRW